MHRAKPSLTVGRYGLINRGETSPRGTALKPSLIEQSSPAWNGAGPLDRAAVVPIRDTWSSWSESLATRGAASKPLPIAERVNARTICRSRLKSRASVGSSGPQVKATAEEARAPTVRSVAPMVPPFPTVMAAARHWDFH